MVDKKHAVYLFTGSDKLLKEKAIRDLTASVLGGGSKDLDYKVFYGAEAETSDVLDHITTIPFLASQRVIVIRNTEKISPELRARLITYIKKPSQSTCLILESADDETMEDFRDVAANLTVKRFGVMTGDEAETWIRSYLAGRGKKIEPGAMIILRELAGQNLLLLSQELEKLVSFIGTRGVVTEADVQEVVGKSLVASAFDLTDAIADGDADKALRIAYDLLRSGKKEFEILGLLCWHLKRVIRAKALQAKGAGQGQIASMLKIGRSYSGYFFKQVSAVSMAALRSKMRVLLETDLGLKRARFSPSLVLEFAIIRLCFA